MDNDDADDLYAKIGEYDESKAYKAPWDWHELPIGNDGPKFHIVTSGETLIVEQHDGRKLRLAAFHQFPTYSGMLCGMPQVRDHFIENAIKRARRIFGAAVEPALLRPRLIALPDYGRQDLSFPLARLPLVTSIGDFESKPAGDRQALSSSGIVIWWQEAFGLPTDEHVLMRLRDLDWMVPAQDSGL